MIQKAINKGTGEPHASLVQLNALNTNQWKVVTAIKDYFFALAEKEANVLPRNGISLAR
jgi:hypothetical protein